MRENPPRSEGPRGPVSVRVLGPGESGRLRDLQALFAEVFEEGDASAESVESHHRSLLASETFIAIAALDGELVVGGIVAYELRQLDRNRNEIYLYDLAVAPSHRRRGIATAMIRELQGIASRRKTRGIFVQAHPEDPAAVALYAKFGVRQSVFHFDLKTERRAGDGA